MPVGNPPLDVNPEAPCTTFESVLSAVRANCPKSMILGASIYNVANMVYSIRNGKDVLEVKYWNSSGVLQSIFIYFNKLLIGAVDYPVFTDWANLPYREIASTEQFCVGANRGWLLFIQQYLSYPPSSTTLDTFVASSYGWVVSGTIIPYAAYAINPGILPHFVSYANKFTDKNVNVTSGPASETNSTNITPSYETVSPGQNSTFQDDFNDGISRITDELSDTATGRGLGENLQVIADSVAGISAKLELISSDLQAALGTNAGSQALAASAASIAVTAKQFRDAGVSVNLPPGSAAGPDGAGVLAAGIAAGAGPSLDALATQIREGIEAAGTTVNNGVVEIYSSLESHLPAIAAAGNATAASVDSTGTATAAAITDSGQAIKLAVDDHKTQFVAETEAMKAAVVAALAALTVATAQTGALTVAESTALVPVVQAAGVAAGMELAPLTALMVSPAGIATITVLGSLIILRALTDVTTAVKNVKDIMSDGKLDIKGDFKRLMEEIRDCICEGLNAEDGAYLEKIVDALGDPHAPGTQPQPDSIREWIKKLSELRDALYVTNGTTPEETSLAELLATTSVEVRSFKGEVIAKFP